MIIDFHDGGATDVAVLTYIHDEFGDDEKDKKDDECTYRGPLRDEPAVSITIDGCPGNDTFQVYENHLDTFIPIL